MRNLIKGVLKTGSGAIASLLIGVISVKIMAVMLGPTGTGLFSLIRQTVFTFATLGLSGQTALVQGVASKEGAGRDSYIRSSFWLYFLGAFFSVVLIELLAPEIAALVFGKRDANLVQLIRWIALPIFLLSVYTYLKGLLNGFRAIGRLAIVEMLGPLITLALVYPICVSVGEGHALAFVWMLSAAQLSMIVVSISILLRNGWLSALFGSMRKMLDRADLRYFFTMAGTAFLVGMIGNGTLLAVRTMVAREMGISQAGLFDLAWSLSGSYVMLLLASFGTYYTPTLSQAAGKEERAALVRRVIRLSTLLMTPLIVIVVVTKPLLVDALYSVKYYASLDMVRWMLIGDYLKITSWVLATAVIVNTDMKIYFWSEVLWYMGFLALSALSTIFFGDLQGIGIAFVVLYFAAVVYYLQYVRRVYELRLTRDLLLPWLIGFAMVVVASIQNWNSAIVSWVPSSLWIIGSLWLVILLLKQTERQVIWSKLRIKLRMNKCNSA